MSMMSEICAAMEADRYRKILLEAIATKNDAILKFAKKHIYPYYMNAVAEAFSSADSDLCDVFES